MNQLFNTAQKIGIISLGVIFEERRGRLMYKAKAIIGPKYLFRFRKPVTIIIKREQGIFIANAPKLGLIEYGETLSEVIKDIGENLEVFYEEAQKADKLSTESEKIINFINKYCEVENLASPEIQRSLARVKTKRFRPFRTSSPFSSFIRRGRKVNAYTC